MRRRALLALRLAAPGHVQAQCRTPRLMLPFPPGGALDSPGRILADRLTHYLKRTGIVVNRMGTGAVAQSARAGKPWAARQRRFAGLARLGRDGALRAALGPLSHDAVASDSPQAGRRFTAEEAPRWRELVRSSRARIH